MIPTDVEAVYETLARKLDIVEPNKRELFLAKLTLLLSRDLADTARICLLIEEAALDLDA